MKFKRLLALETIYLQNTIPPACSIHQRPRINTIAPLDQFQRIQISAELKQWLLTTIRHYSHYLYYSLFTIRCSLLATIHCLLFAIRDYSLFVFSRHPIGQCNRTVNTCTWTEQIMCVCCCWTFCRVNNCFIFIKMYCQCLVSFLNVFILLINW